MSARGKWCFHGCVHVKCSSTHVVHSPGQRLCSGCERMKVRKEYFQPMVKIAPPPPFPYSVISIRTTELTLGGARVRSDAHTTCNHLPQRIKQWFSKRLHSRSFHTQAPTRTDTNTQKIKTQLQRGKEDCVYTAIYIYIEEVGAETVPSEQVSVHLSYGGYREENRREQLNWDKSRQMLQVEWGGNINVCPFKSGNHSFTAYQREKWENV